MNRLLAPGAAAIAGILVGAALVASRFVIDQVGPASLALMRYAIGFLCLLPFALAAPRPGFRPRDLVPIAGLGIIQFGILIALMNVGLRYIPAGRAAMIFATFPLLTMLVAAALGREHLTLAKSLGVALTIAGVGVAVGGGAPSDGPAWPGDLAIFAAAAAGALCSVLYRPYLARYPALPIGAVAMLASVAFLAVPAAAEGFFSAIPPLSAAGWLAVLFIGIGSGIGYFLWLWALGHASPTRVTIFLGLSPVTAALLGALILGEAMTTALLAGLVLLGTGLVLAHLGPLSPRPAGG